MVPGLDRAHTRVGHDADEVVVDGAVPLLFLVLRQADRLARAGVEGTVLWGAADAFA